MLWCVEVSDLVCDDDHVFLTAMIAEMWQSYMSRDEVTYNMCYWFDSSCVEMYTKFKILYS